MENEITMPFSKAIRILFGEKAEIGALCAPPAAADPPRHRLSKLDQGRLIEELKEALARVKTLTGLLHICSGCNRILNEHSRWEHLEAFFEEHLDVLFHHGLCSDCAREQFPATGAPCSLG